VTDRNGSDFDCWDMEYPLEVIMLEDGVT